MRKSLMLEKYLALDKRAVKLKRGGEAMKVANVGDVCPMVQILKHG